MESSLTMQLFPRYGADCHIQNMSDAEINEKQDKQPVDTVDGDMPTCLVEQCGNMELKTRIADAKANQESVITMPLHLVKTLHKLNKQIAEAKTNKESVITMPLHDVMTLKNLNEPTNVPLNRREREDMYLEQIGRARKKRMMQNRMRFLKTKKWLQNIRKPAQNVQHRFMEHAWTSYY